MKRYKAREGNTGILFLTDADGKEERYIPDYDLDKARELLLELQEFKDADGKCLKDNYWAEGFNWYPAMVSYLYWHVFFQYVKYKPLLHDLLDNKIECWHENKVNFRNITTFIKKGIVKSSFKTRLFFFLVEVNNWIVIRKYQADLMFFRFSLDDFRSKEIGKTLEELGVQYLQVLPPDRIASLIRNIFKVKPYYFFGGSYSNNIFRKSYNLDQYDKYKQVLFGKAIKYVEMSASAYIREYKKHLRLLRGTSFKTFYGLDDCNGYIFPILYACRQNGIRTVAHQHGAYVKRHAGYIMEGITKEQYRWFDKVIVWGEYWKDHLLKISKVYSPEIIVIGSNKLSWKYENNNNDDTKPQNILIPYEFLTNTYKVGLYIQKFIDMGFNVFFKPRSDERLEDQLEAYCLPKEYLQKIKILHTLDSKVMKGIDIIAGTMTTLIYELLPFQKIVWILDTEYKHLEDLIEDGFAHKVKYDDLHSLDARFFTKTLADKNFFFDPVSLEETLVRHVLSFIN